MKSFNEWYEENSWDIENYYDAEKSFKAGQQSKQAEVDDLKREMLNKTNEAYADGQRSMRKMIKSNEDELQKRIDGALKFASDAHSDLNIGMLMIVDILKGDQS